jgi:hypothetical protein
MISDCAFDLDPGTMRRSGDAAAFFRDLYETYNDELAALTAAMADMHRSMRPTAIARISAIARANYSIY